MTFVVRRLGDDRKRRPLPWKRMFLAVLHRSGPILVFARRFWQQHQEQKKHDRRARLLKRIFVILIAVLCCALLIAGTVRALIALQIVSIKNLVSVAGAPLQEDAWGQTNILLLGQGDESHDGVDLTDTIMVASLDPTHSKSVVLLSLPRDLYFLNTLHMGKGRINSLYRDYKIQLVREGKTTGEASRLAMQELANEIGKALNLQMHYIIKVDFIGFVQAVDAIGGIDIEVPEDLVDPEYPGPNYTYETFSIAAGPQHLDGETALKYARSRHSTSDFDRSARQQQILRAIAEKGKEKGMLSKPNQILSLLSIMSNHVETTLEVREMVGLGTIGKDLDASRIITMQLNDANGLYGGLTNKGGFLYNPPRDQFGGASVLLPVSIPEYPVTWKQVQVLSDLLLHHRPLFLKTAPLTILNAGAVPGSARKLGGELIRYGLPVDRLENSEEPDLPTSLIEASPDQKEHAQFLGEMLGMGVHLLPASPDTVSPPSITLLLGEDYTYQPLQSHYSPSLPPL